MYEYKQCTDGLLCQGNILRFIYWGSMLDEQLAPL